MQVAARFKVQPAELPTQVFLSLCHSTGITIQPLTTSLSLNGFQAKNLGSLGKMLL
jgi:hypothetical protein